MAGAEYFCLAQDIVFQDCGGCKITSSLSRWLGHIHIRFGISERHNSLLSGAWLLFFLLYEWVGDWFAPIYRADQY